MMRRSGSLLLSFTSVTNPDGTDKRIDASVAGVSLDRRSHTRVRPEGEMQGDRPGAAWTLLNLGVTGGLAKVADDGTQLILRSEEHTSELQSLTNLVCRLLLEKKKRIE